MYRPISQIIFRKILVTFVVSSFIAILLGTAFTTSHMEFAGWVYVYFIVVGLIVLLYGGVVSCGLEYIHRKRKPLNVHLYALLHGLFGLLAGSFFLPFILIGGLAATAYGYVDRWFMSIPLPSKKFAYIVASPLILFLILLVFLPGLVETDQEQASETPFTKEKALEKIVTNDKTFKDFPEAGGTNEETNAFGNHLVRTTNVKEIEKDVYLITFKEVWDNRGGSGYFFWKYKVTRDSITEIEHGGETPILKSA